MWSTLGLEPTRDTTAIRRAYRAKLRDIDIDIAPDAFITLRAAFEAALNWAEAFDRRDLMEDDAVEITGREDLENQDEMHSAGDFSLYAEQKTPSIEIDGSEGVSLNEPSWSSKYSEGEEQALLDVFEDAVMRDNAALAVEFFDRLTARGAIGIGAERDRYIQLVISSALADVSFSPDRLRALVARVMPERHGAAEDSLSKLRANIAERIAADQWSDALSRQRSRPAIPFIGKSAETRVARLLLKDPRQKGFRNIKWPKLSHALQAYYRHQPWIGERVDESWIEEIELRIPIERRRRRIRRLISIPIILVLLFGCFCLDLGPEGRSAMLRGYPTLALALWSDADTDDGQFEIGYMYDSGQNAPRDVAAAFGWYVRAADGGNAVAQYNLGTMYLRGRGVARSSAQAAAYFQKAAAQHYGSALYALGWMDETGQNGPWKLGEAMSWYRLAGQQGDTNAELALGENYTAGRGVARDLREAAAWLRKAAAQGNAQAAVELGLMYDNGQGVPQNPVEAVRWYREAADRGNAAGQFDLGITRAAGIGITRDDVDAYKWLSLAAAGLADDAAFRSRAIAERNALASRLTRAQLARARRLTHDWKPISDGPPS